MSEASRKAPHPIDVHVGSRVRLRRMMVGMSQDKLAEALSLTFQQVQKYEKGINRVGASRLFQISKILNVPVQFFYDDFGQEDEIAVTGFAEEAADDTSASEFMELLSTPEGVQLCKSFSQIQDVTVRRKLLDLIKALAETHNS
ncbi:MAG: helix-turn-helix transcriptional regulator [Aquisalinus sp.]|nr:helix-turn-helix transcriptional regulator [Aquisalinus sp.]